VVQDVTDEKLQVSLKRSKEKLDPESEIGDSLGMKTDIDALGRIAAQSAKTGK